MPRFKKGSVEAKKYMASIRKKKATTKKAVTKKVTKKAVAKKNSSTVGAKKPIKKAVSKLHKDTKSHNVNIKIVSGTIAQKSIVQRNHLERDLNNAINQLEILKRKAKEEKTNKNYKMEAFHKRLLVKYPKYIQSLKKQIRDVNKIILAN